MSRRPGRWWRPTPRRNVRPAVRSTRRTLPTSGRVGEVWEAGYRAGLAADITPAERDRYEQLRRLLDAEDDLLDAEDDLLDVADQAGVTPLADAGFEDELVPEIEAWLREQDGR
ncbi:hypothetical protein ACL02O_23740 [Micromonospora sp. MS34]|uniref:hypothetical protein n=1 Tax=Micromonospora sp. MS34 TaxID=3385971 RepID=UPI0039A14BD0